MTAVNPEEADGQELLALLELSDACVAAARTDDPDRVAGALAAAVDSDGERFLFLLEHWATMLVDFCGHQMPGAALREHGLAGILALGDATPLAQGRYDEAGGLGDGPVDQFLLGGGETARAYALHFLLQAALDRNRDLMAEALVAIGGWLPLDQAEFARVALMLVADGLPQAVLPSHLARLVAVLHAAATADRREEMTLPLTRLAALHWAERELGSELLAIESVRLVGLDYPTTASRTAAITILSRALARNHPPGQPVQSHRAGRTLSDSSPLPTADPIDARDITACRTIALAAAGRPEDIPAEIDRAANGVTIEPALVLLWLARRLAVAG